MEDFEEENQNAVVVSTMHRAKGKEFDNVYILLEKKDVWSAQDLRVLYVAMTRAKHTLRMSYPEKVEKSPKKPLQS